MHQENHQDLSRYADDLAFAFPNILGLARGLSDNDPVADVIAFHPIVLGFLNGFGRTMLRVASLKLQLEPESQALVHYRAIANIMNRFGEMDRFETVIENLHRQPSEEFSRYQELGIQFLRAASTSGNQAITEQILKLVQSEVMRLVDEQSLNPIAKH
jgi:hypothetical protein